jgi:hypothetical protein
MPLSYHNQQYLFFLGTAFYPARSIAGKNTRDKEVKSEKAGQ